MDRVHLQRTPQAVAQDKRDNLIFIGASFIVFLLKFLFTQWPETKVLEYFFCCDPNNTPMTKPAYVDYFANCWSYILIYFTMLIAHPKTKEYVFYVTLIWIAYFLEYYFMYNNPFFKLWNVIPIGISTVLGICFVAMFTREALRK